MDAVEQVLLAGDDVLAQVWVGLGETLVELVMGFGLREAVDDALYAGLRLGHAGAGAPVETRVVLTAVIEIVDAVAPVGVLRRGAGR